VHTSHILHRRPCEPTSIVDWSKLASVNRNLPFIGHRARQSQRAHSHSFGCLFQWGGTQNYSAREAIGQTLRQPPFK